jgi:hypothetical protein
MRIQKLKVEILISYKIKKNNHRDFRNKILLPF